MAVQIFHGSCDCAKVNFEVGLDLEVGTFKCNCRLCFKKRFWGAVAKPDTFRLISGENELTVYGVRRRHHFCKHCGIKIFGRGLDGVRIVVNVAAIDDLDPKKLAAAPIRYVDGLHDNFTSSPDFTAHL